MKMDMTNALYVRWLLNMNDDAVKVAVLEIYNQQSSFEKRHSTTVHKNGRGFRINHAKLGSQFAQMILNEEDFSFEDMNEARELAIHYVNQIVSIHLEKQIMEQEMSARREQRMQSASLRNEFLGRRVTLPAPEAGFFLSSF